MDVTTTTPTPLTTCDGCGSEVSYTGTCYVDGAGQLCTTICTSPMPAELIGIKPPF